MVAMSPQQKKTPLYLIEEDFPHDLQLVTPRLLVMRNPDDDLDPMTGMLTDADAKRLLHLTNTNVDMGAYGRYGDGSDYLDESHYWQDMLVDMEGYGGPVTDDPLFRDEYGPGSLGEVEIVPDEGLGDMGRMALFGMQRAVGVAGQIERFKQTYDWLESVRRAARKGDVSQYGISGVVDNILSRVTTIKERLTDIRNAAWTGGNNLVNIANNIRALYQTATGWYTTFRKYWKKLQGYYNDLIDYYGYARKKVEDAWGRFEQSWSNLVAKVEETKLYLLDVKNRFATFINELGGRLTRFENYFGIMQTDIRNLTTWATKSFDKTAKAVQNTVAGITSYLSTINNNLQAARNTLDPLKASVDQIKTQLAKFSPDSIEASLETQNQRLERLLTAFELQSDTLNKFLGKADELIEATKGISLF